MKFDASLRERRTSTDTFAATCYTKVALVTMTSAEPRRAHTSTKMRRLRTGLTIISVVDINWRYQPARVGLPVKASGFFQGFFKAFSRFLQPI
jgi:hypothetical protein